VKVALLDILRVPGTNDYLTLQIESQIGDEVISGALVAPNGARYPITKGIPRFVPHDDYVENFSFEWTKHRTTQLDSAHGTRESEERFAESLPYPLAELAGKTVLDVGCGMGRFAEIVLKYGGTVIGIDLSYAVDAAWDNMGRQANAHFVQANVYDLPFAPESFDLIYSLGVLHHTPDPRKAFNQLPRLLKPGGTIMTTFYAAYNKAYVAASTFWRTVLRPLPRQWLYRFAHISIPLYYLWRLPALGKVLGTLLPLSQHPRAEWRVLDTFDWYSPQYQFYYTHPEVFRWYQEHGLENIVVKGPGISLAGRRAQ
jgi:2-polyprenyl-3-methyl-5-hydroxy-6-metoxy-1,4-benzoquinol methylase